MHLELDDVIRATGGELVAPPAGGRPAAPPRVDGATIDSRSVRTGQLFVPIVAERDGHDFIPAAVEAGAVAYLTSRRPGPGAPNVPAVLVTDTQAALADLGRLARRHLGDRVVGVTGSVGKTSVKDLLASVLGRRWVTAAPLRSFNNELGVPLTLINAPEGATAAAIEMGARGIGHIAHLCSIARPTLGIVTVVGGAHLELFGSIDEVARGKGELIEALPADGWAVLNADDERVAAMATRSAARVVRFGSNGDVRAEEVLLDHELRPRFRLVSPWGGTRVALGVRGAHMVTNALAAAAAGLALGVDPAAVAEGLEAAVLSPWRMELGHAASGATVINDAYNANPMSMRAALRALVALPGGSESRSALGLRQASVPESGSKAAPRSRSGSGRRVAVLGLMAELGPDGGAEHRAVAQFAADLGVEVLAVGTDAYGIDPLPDADAALRRLGPLVAGDAVLIKASRVVGLEALAARLVVDGS